MTNEMMPSAGEQHGCHHVEVRVGATSAKEYQAEVARLKEGVGNFQQAVAAAQKAKEEARNAQKAAEEAKTAAETACGDAQKARAATEDIRAEAETLDPESPATAEKVLDEKGRMLLRFGIPKGPMGQPILGTLTLSTDWEGNGPFTQDVTGQIAVDSRKATNRYKVDLQPDAALIQQMQRDQVTYLAIKNEDGLFTAEIMGGKLTAPVTVQMTIIDVGYSKEQMDAISSAVAAQAKAAGESAAAAAESASGAKAALDTLQNEVNAVLDEVLEGDSTEEGGENGGQEEGGEEEQNDG